MEWRYHTVLLDADSSKEAAAAVDFIFKKCADPELKPPRRGPTIRIVERKELQELQKVKGLKGRDAFALCLLAIIEKDKDEGMSKRSLEPRVQFDGAAAGTTDEDGALGFPGSLEGESLVSGFSAGFGEPSLDVVYLLRGGTGGFPNSTEEADQLMRLLPTPDAKVAENLLDAVVQIVTLGDNRPPGTAEPSVDLAAPSVDTVASTTTSTPHGPASAVQMMGSIPSQAAFDEVLVSSKSAAKLDDVEGDFDASLEDRPMTVPLEAPQIKRERKKEEQRKQMRDGLPGKLMTESENPTKHDGWRDLTFDQIPSDLAKDKMKALEELMDEVLGRIFGNGVERCLFREWLSTIDEVDVPFVPDAAAKSQLVTKESEVNVGSLDPLRGGTGAWAEDPVLASYATLTAEIPDQNISPGVLLYCMVEAVVLNDETMAMTVSAPSPGLAIFSPRAKSFEPLEGQDGHMTLRDDGEAPVGFGLLGPGTVTLDFGDDSASRVSQTEIDMAATRGPPEALEGLCSRMLIAIERRIYRAMQLPRILGHGGLPLNPTIPDYQRGVEASELITFAGHLSPEDIARTQQTAYFERLLNHSFPAMHVRAQWQLNNRSFFEKLSAHVASQVLAREMLSAPVVLRYYDAARDELLLALHHPTARGRCGEAQWDATQALSHRPPFPSWNASAAHNNYTPRTKTAMTAVVRIKTEDLEKISQQTITLFPSDHSLITLSRLDSSEESWLTIYLDGHIFGLRKPTYARSWPGAPEPTALDPRPATPAPVPDLPPGEALAAHFVSDFADGVRILVSEGEREPNTKCTYTTLPTGLCVSACTDGVITMRFVTISKAGAPDPVLEESGRKIFSKGTVVRHLRNGAVECLFADGAVLYCEEGDSFYCLTTIDGRRYRVAKSGGGGMESLLPVEATCELDPETGTKVQRCNGATVARWANGTIVCVHRDGTTVRTDPNEEHVLVEAAGYGAVFFDVQIDNTARAHSRGEKVPIAKGGERIRSKIALHDGTKILTTYNTRITSKVRGKVVIVRPDFSEIIAEDSKVPDMATVRFRPRSIWNGGSVLIDAATEPPKEDESKATPDQIGGAYIFNLERASLHLEDSEHNIFNVKLRAEASSSVEVNLAGTSENLDKVEAVVNHPKPPRLFVIRRDGSAMEMLRQEDVDDFNKKIELGAIEVISDDPEQCFVDPETLGATQRTYHVRLRRPPPVGVFEFCFPETCKGFPAFPGWHTQRLPVCCRLRPEDIPHALAPVMAPTVLLRRVWQEMQPLSEEGREKLQKSSEKWRKWRQEREAALFRFIVEDPRAPEDIEAEKAIQKQLKKAIKQAKINKKKEKQKALEAEKAALAEAGNASAGPTPSALPDDDDEDDEYDFDDDEESDVEPEAPDQVYDEAAAAFEQVRRMAEENEDDADTLATEPSNLEEKSKGSVGSQSSKSSGWIDEASVRAGLVQVLGRAVSRDEADERIGRLEYRTYPKEDRFSFDDFYRVLKEALDEDSSVKASRPPLPTAPTVAPDESAVLRAQHGTFWSTGSGARLEGSLPPRPPPKQKSDILTMVGEPLPRSHTLGDMNVDESEYLEDQASDDNDSEAKPDPHLDGTFRDAATKDTAGPSVHGFTVSTQPSLHERDDLHRMNAEELHSVAVGSGHNAVRAVALEKRDANERLREGERPRDHDIHGHERPQKVRVRNRATSKPLTEGGPPQSAESQYSVISAASSRGRTGSANGTKGADATASRTGSQGTPAVARVSFEITPAILELGALNPGSSVTQSVSMRNTGGFAARYRIRHGEYCRVSERPRGPIAAGMAVPLSIEATFPAALVGTDVQDSIYIVSEHEELELMVTASVVAPDYR